MRPRMIAILLVGAVCCSMGLAQEPQPLDWPCDVVPLGTDQALDRAPVVSDLSLQPQGRLLAAVGDDHCVRLCDRQTGRVLNKLRGHRDWIRAVVFTPDGNELLTAGYDQSILRWDPETGEQLGRLEQATFAIASLAVDPQGKWLAAAGFSSSIWIIDLETGERIHQWTQPCGDQRVVAFSPDSRWLAAAGRDGTIRVWSVDSGELAHEIQAHRRRVHDLAFSGDSRRLISGGDDSRLQVADLETGIVVQSIDGSGAKIFALEWLDDDLVATAGTGNDVRVWDLSTEREMGRLVGHEGSVTSLAFDGSRLYSTGFDTFLRIWRVNANFAQAPGSDGPRVSLDPETIIE